MRGRPTRRIRPREAEIPGNSCETWRDRHGAAVKPAAKGLRQAAAVQGTGTNAGHRAASSRSSPGGSGRRRRTPCMTVLPARPRHGGAAPPPGGPPGRAQRPSARWFACYRTLRRIASSAFHRTHCARARARTASTGSGGRRGCRGRPGTEGRTDMVTGTGMGTSTVRARVGARVPARCGHGYGHGYGHGAALRRRLD